MSFAAISLPPCGELSQRSNTETAATTATSFAGLERNFEAYYAAGPSPLRAGGLRVMPLLEEKQYR